MNYQPLISPSKHHDYLDGWRGLAIALVLESHFLNWLPLTSGRMGVDLFFALSGFLMSGVLFIQRQPLRKFYKRRISRIAPAFLVFVLIIYTYSYLKEFAFTKVEFISTIFFIRTYIPTIPGIWAANVPIGHLWSLNIEEHCYIFMSALILFPTMRGREGFALIMSGLVCIGIGLLYVIAKSGAPSWGVLGTEVAASHLLIAAGYRLINAPIKALIPPWAPIFTFFAASICYSNLVPWWSATFLSPIFLAFTVNHLSESYQWLKSLLGMYPLRLLGIWSFSIYLWQQPFYHIKDLILGGAGVALACAMVTALTIFYLLEQPCRLWLNRNW